MICAVCNREGRGFGFIPRLARLRGPPEAACSMTCLDTIARWRRTMIDPTPNEITAMEHGGQMGGEYLDSIAKTDLAALSPEQWQTFVEAVITGYCDHLRDLAGRDRGRLDGMAGEVPF
ncbi:conserved hypothetical protein [Candidatus Terasakiella magnetica]|jgi:hypothetical protein|uniref:Uncharacterized protein n=1 Tax=Paramagnetospirillum magneticum (strain ATCC 700264 / AMB-1) TaxID=342108 RepID=Q2WAG4_PARM1|nr:DUF6511 domain-containing protein [Paramagnetospirillum magneticum]BAE49161.1 hypothetical protein amb0357 [Paramagnetospirillum magneticum AMB-1]CAA7618946.1 conserved hypothetical protein [Candidatus Terasakiella magnetica]